MVKKTVLDNGIRVITESVPGVHSVSIGVWVKAGARHEREGENGLAHFIEHMLFKGTGRHSAFEIARLIDSVGGVINAFTAKEYTCFYIKVLRQHMELAVDLLCGIFFESLFQQEEIEKERNVIIQEINMVKDTPDDYIQDLFNRAFFAKHPLGYNILGELESVQGFGRKEICNFYEREYFSPRKIIVSAAGSIEHDVLLEQVAGRFGRLSGNADDPPLGSFEPARDVSFHRRDLEQVHVCQGSRGVSQNEDSRYAMYILNTILGGSMSSRLFQEVRENRGLAYVIYSFLVSYIETGMFGVYMAVVNEALEESLEIVVRELKQLKEVPVSLSELSDAKEQLKGNMLLSMESTDSRMSRLAKCELYHGGYVPIEDILDKIDAVTPEEVLALARSTFKDDLFTFTFLGPVGLKSIGADTLRID